MVLGGLLPSWPAAAEQADGWLERATLTGDWGGARGRLADHGIDVWAGYTAGLWSVLGGGFYAKLSNSIIHKS